MSDKVSPRQVGMQHPGVCFLQFGRCSFKNRKIPKKHPNLPKTFSTKTVILTTNQKVSKQNWDWSGANVCKYCRFWKSRNAFFKLPCLFLLEQSSHSDACSSVQSLQITRWLKINWISIVNYHRPTRKRTSRKQYIGTFEKESSAKRQMGKKVTQAGRYGVVDVWNLKIYRSPTQQSTTHRIPRQDLDLNPWLRSTSSPLSTCITCWIYLTTEQSKRFAVRAGLM